MAPTVVVLGGPNGSGKTTSARTILAEMLQLFTFVNADTIAEGLAGFAPENSAMEAGRIMLQRLRQLANDRVDFAFETTLSGRFYANWLTSLRQEGYIVHLIYFWLANPDIAVARVAERVKLGGHDVPEETIRQRYSRGIKNFFALYCPVVSSWEVFNNSDSTYELVASKYSNGVVEVKNNFIWNTMQMEVAK